LEQLDIRDRVISLHAHELPKHSNHRRDLGRLLADRIASFFPPQRLELEDLTGSDAAALEDPLFKAFNEVTVLPYPIGRSSVVSASDERFFRWVPPLSHVVLPVIEKKLTRHGVGAADLTLVIHLVEHEILNEDSLAEVRAALAEPHRAFRSIYLVREQYPS